MDGIATAAAVMAALGWVGLGALYLFVVRPLQAKVQTQAHAQAHSEAADQWRKLTTRLDRLEERLQAAGGRPADHGPAKSGAEMEELRRELDYLKSKLSTLLTPPETPPHPLPGLAAAPPSPPPDVAAPPPTAAFENQRVSDIVARYRGRLRTGHIDALTRHFSVNPTGLFLELEERGERLVFPAQEIVYAGDFEQNYRFVFDCAEPGGGYVVVLSPARLDAQGRVVARGRLRIE